MEFCEYISIGEAAEMLGVCTATIRNWDKSGKIKCTRNPMNNFRRCKKADVENILKKFIEDE